MGKNAKERRRAILKKGFEEDSPKNRKHPVDRFLSVETIDYLRSHGLLLDDFPFFPSNHVAYPSGYIVGLPCNLDGNCLFDEHKPLMGPESIEIDMPTINIWKSGQKVSIGVHQYVPGPGPGDFVENYDGETTATAAIIDYFFNPKNEHYISSLSAHNKG